jgi:hypothetical protein
MVVWNIKMGNLQVLQPTPYIKNRNYNQKYLLEYFIITWCCSCIIPTSSKNNLRLIIAAFKKT